LPTSWPNYVDLSWLFWIEALPGRRCRLVSRFRVDYSAEVGLRLAYGPQVVEPVGLVTDRRMLLGIQERAESVWRKRPDPP